MTNEQKAAVERAITGNSVGFQAVLTSAMEHVINNPGEFGLMLISDSQKAIQERLDQEKKYYSEAKKYREALERIAAIAVDYQPSIQTEAALAISKEALKQEVNND